VQRPPHRFGRAVGVVDEAAAGGDAEAADAFVGGGEAAAEVGPVLGLLVGADQGGDEVEVAPAEMDGAGGDAEEDGASGVAGGQGLGDAALLEDAPAALDVTAREDDQLGGLQPGAVVGAVERADQPPLAEAGGVHRGAEQVEERRVLAVGGAQVGAARRARQVGAVEDRGAVGAVEEELAVGEQEERREATGIAAGLEQRFADRVAHRTSSTCTSASASGPAWAPVSSSSPASPRSR